MNLNNLSKEIYREAVKKGWWDDDRSFGVCIALCHSELSEALEDYRNGLKINEVKYAGKKPCGVPTELADTIIRILDMCGKWDIDIEKVIKDKLAYNKTREYKHGGKII